MTARLSWNQRKARGHRPRLQKTLSCMNCKQCEERMSDYLENAISVADRHQFEFHLQSCAACSELLSGMKDVLAWGSSFPIYEAPQWLPSRILANTPRIARESGVETLRLAWRWITQPRTAMAVFTAILVLGWLGNLAGISPDWGAIVRNPTSIYDQGEAAVSCVYEGAVHAYYSSALVTEIEAQIEQLMEIS
jgi:Putative zinc-finger